MSEAKVVRGPGWRPTEVHPSAEAFRMMSDDELADLAADIKEHGLLVPIAVDADGLLVDGRNRLRACEIAGVEPTFQNLNGQDTTAFVASFNLHRRDLNKGQKAIGLAILYPEPGKRGRGNKSEAIKSAESAGFSSRRLNEARAILRHSRLLADQVRDGAKFFDAALKEVEEAQTVSQSADAKLSELQRHAPDLAELVAEERLKLEEAHSTLKKRQAEAAAVEANKRETMLRLTEGVWRSTTAWASDEFVADLDKRLSDDEFREVWLERLRYDPERLKDIERGAKAFAAIVKRITKEG